MIIGYCNINNTIKELKIYRKLNTCLSAFIERISLVEITQSSNKNISLEFRCRSLRRVEVLR